MTTHHQTTCDGPDCDNTNDADETQMGAGWFYVQRRTKRTDRTGFREVEFDVCSPACLRRFAEKMETAG